MAGALITAAANAINDVYDLDIDRINRPYRPLPKGEVKPHEAIIFSIVCFVVGVASSALINRQALLIAFIFSVLLFLYSAIFKRMMLIGNVTVSLATAFAFIFGGVAVGHIENAIFPAIFAFLMHFGREIIKDMEDVEGDRLYQAKTLPIQFGMRPAKVLTTVLFTTLIAVTIVPFVMQVYGRWYLIIVAFGVNTVLLISLFSLWKTEARSTLRVLSAVLKADMLVGLVAIYAGRW